MTESISDYTIGLYLAERLAQIGVKHHFTVPGDYNVALLDQLLRHQGTEQVYSCNETNCCFSAQGYARENGAGAAIVTFGVGGLPAMNGLASACAENIPVILISGAANSHDIGSGRVLHHSLGTSDLEFQLEIARKLTCVAERITDVETAAEKIDKVIFTALREKQPGYLEICCNLPSMPCPRPGPFSLSAPSDRIRSSFTDSGGSDVGFQFALDEATHILQQAKRPMIVIGRDFHMAQAQKEVIALAECLNCPVAVLALSKGTFPEQHRLYGGVYWGEATTPSSLKEMIEEADTIILLTPGLGCVTTSKWTDWPQGERILLAEVNRITFGTKVTCNDIPLKLFLAQLARTLPPRRDQWRTIPAFTLNLPIAAPKAPLSNDEMIRQVAAFLTPTTTLWADCGSTWFNMAGIVLPDGCHLETEMQWVHIGWSVPAAYGAAVAAPERQHIVMIGDGSFQLTGQEISQMVRYGLPVLIILVNNGGFAMEQAIHSGPYNEIPFWDYTAFVQSFNDERRTGANKALTFKAHTGSALADALEHARAHRNGPTLIECFLAADDLPASLMPWCRNVARTNARSPQPRSMPRP